MDFHLVGTFVLSRKHSNLNLLYNKSYFSLSSITHAHTHKALLQQSRIRQNTVHVVSVQYVYLLKSHVKLTRRIAMTIHFQILMELKSTTWKFKRPRTEKTAQEEATAGHLTTSKSSTSKSSTSKSSTSKSSTSKSSPMANDHMKVNNVGVQHLELPMSVSPPVSCCKCHDACIARCQLLRHMNTDHNNAIITHLTKHMTRNP